MTVLFRVSVMAALLLGTTGCSYKDTYPEHWAGYDRERSTCAGIAGRYQNLGQAADKTRTGVAHLSSWLFKYPDGNGSDIIEITYQPNLLWVRGLTGDIVVAEKTFSSETDSLECHDDGVVVDPYAGTARIGNPVAGYTSESTTLRRAKDGALIVDNSGTGVGLVYMLVPVAVSGSSLYRFPAVR